MKRIFFLVLWLAGILCAEENMPPASQLLASSRAQLPPYPIHMVGTLKEKAPNGFVKKSLLVEITLDWNGDPAHAAYRISDEKTKQVQAVKIQWLPEGTAFHSVTNGTTVEAFNPNEEIEGVGVTWFDLSFSFLWSQEATTLRTGKKFGKECYVISVPRPKNHSLLIWIEQKTGRMMGAEEYDAERRRQKVIKVVSVKDFDGIWMAKDLDIIWPLQGKKTSLRVNHLEAILEK